MTEKTRLIGVDLCRGLATYAVILVHSGDETWRIPIDSQAIHFRLLFYFGVPFFLATSFYFMTSKPDLSTSPKFWKARIERILVPYGVWSVIYLVSRILVFSITLKSERLHELLQDPLSLIFFGGASFHLYFLPLLFSGTFLMLIAPYFIGQKIGIRNLLLVTILSILLYEFLLVSGNSFQLGSDVAFQQFLNLIQLNQNQFPLIRLVFVQVSWIVKCLPYFFTAMTLNYLLHNSRYLKLNNAFTSIVSFALFLFCNTFGRLQLPEALNEVLSAYALLIFGISISSFFRKSNLVIRLGVCSYGIYLIHPFVMNFVKIIDAKVFPHTAGYVSIPSMLMLSIPCFFLSWLIVACLTKSQTIAKYIFGI